MARWLKAVNGIIVDVNVSDTKPEDIGDIKYYAQIPNVGIGWEMHDSCWYNNKEDHTLRGIVIRAELDGSVREITPTPGIE